MGGCRCSYRDCKVRSDGKTHLFHYPVFERVRCQKWLKNANKLDLLELTLGQLKNRVVCQYHFKDSMFMNAKKNKLKFEAVPTENGPYCKGKNRKNNSEINFEPESFTNTNNLLIDDKKTHYYQKYSDFLTKDQASNVTLENDNKKGVLEATIIALDSTHLKNYDLEKNIVEPELFNSTSNKQIDVNNLQLPKTTNKQIERGDKMLVNIVPVEFENKSNREYITPKSPNKNHSAPRTKKIKILENKEVDFKFITVPQETDDFKLPKFINGIQITGDIKQLQSVSNFEVTDVKPSQSLTNFQIVDVKPSQFQFRNVEQPQPVPALQNTNVSHSVTEIQNPDVKLSQTVTEIQNIDVKPSQTVTTLQDAEHDKPLRRITRAIKSAQQLVNNGNIESRLQQLENKLMLALNRNTQELGEVRKLVEKNANNNKAACSSRSFGTQTKLSEEQEKRYHYNQLSRFLSTETKSVLYEALFLSKYDVESNTPKPKKRKCIL